MEVAKVNTPTPVYQGSGLEVAAKPAAAVKAEAARPELSNPEIKTVLEGSAKPKITAAAGSVKLKAGAGPEAQAEKAAVPEGAEDRKGAAEAQEAANNKAIKRAVEEVNRKAKNNELIFGVHDATNRVMIKVVDRDTKEVLREFPPEKTLDMIAKVWELAGIMIDERG